MDDRTEKIYDALVNLELNPKRMPRGWSIRCPNPNHNGNGHDRNNSAFCFEDRGTIYCYGGCPVTNINRLLDRPVVTEVSMPKTEQTEHQKPNKKVGDFTEFWESLDFLDHDVKGVPAEELNKRGWRWYSGGKLAPGVFIPYFDVNREIVEFAQIRHEQGERRFSFPRGGYKQQLYGKEQFKVATTFIALTEGSRDSVILSMAGLPAVAVPNAQSYDLLDEFGDLCENYGLRAVLALDTDQAGIQLQQRVSFSYISRPSPVGKDVGDLYADGGISAVREYYQPFIRG